MVVVWAVRLGSFLFLRVRKAGTDDRFDDIKPSFVRFLNIWTLQGLWVTITAAAALGAITSTTRVALGRSRPSGSSCGRSASVSRSSPMPRRAASAPIRPTRAASSRPGLWASSRHPNYFGEILLWVGVAVVAVPALQGWQWVALISPVFVTLLLTRVSGVPLLEKTADEKWGGQADYEAYKSGTLAAGPRSPRARPDGGAAVRVMMSA